MHKLITALALAFIFPSPSLARPPLPPKTVDCSFNGVPEKCSKSFDTDGSEIVTWPGGPTNSYECERYQPGRGLVYSANKEYAATCQKTQNGTIYQTNNGRTFIGN